MTGNDVLPLTPLLIVGVPAFLIGVLVGMILERRKRHHLGMLTHRPTTDPSHKEPEMRAFNNRFRDWYADNAPAMVTATAILALVGIWIGAAATVTNGQQDRRADAEAQARDAAFSEVQKCFDQYAQEQSTSSSEVREASVTKDEATDRFNRALKREGQAFLRWTKTLSDGLADPTTFDRPAFLLANRVLTNTLEARDRAARAVEEAQRALDKARSDNPVPEAPSEFCAVKP